MIQYLGGGGEEDKSDFEFSFLPKGRRRPRPEHLNCWQLTEVKFSKASDIVFGCVENSLADGGVHMSGCAKQRKKD